MEDEKIIELYWQRDEEALKQTNEKYGAFCYCIAQNILKNAEDSKECVNDTWFKTWLVIPPKRPEFFQAFLGKITRNLSLDRYRRSRASKRGAGCMDVIYEEPDSVARIADRYSMSESKVKSSLMRSRNKLKAFLEKEGISV